MPKTEMTTNLVESSSPQADRAPLTPIKIQELLRLHNVDLSAESGVFALPDAERATLQQEQSTLPVDTIVRPIAGFIRGEQTASTAAVLFRRPDAPGENVEVSVCGKKEFLGDVLMDVRIPGEPPQTTIGATVAVLSMTDSPVHHHGVTTEIYRLEPNSGRGLLVLNDAVFEVGPGDEIILLPGVHHGVFSFDPNLPIVATLHFMPGLAKKGDRLRDEQIDHLKTSSRIKELAGLSDEGPNGPVIMPERPTDPNHIS